MANNCNLISQNGMTGDREKLCAGDYYGGASVHCKHNYTIDRSQVPS